MRNLLSLLLSFCGTLAVLVIALAAWANDRAVARRLDLIGLDAEQRQPPLPERWLASIQGGHAAEGLRSPFAFRMQRRWDLAASPAYLLLIGLIAAAAAWLLGRFVFGLQPGLSALLAAGGFWLLPRALLVSEQRRSDAAFAEALPDAIDMVVRILRAGLPVAVAIRIVGGEANPPVSAVFSRIADETEIGLPLAESMGRVSATIDNSDFRFFAVAIALQQTTGGNLILTLEALAEIIRRRRTMRIKGHVSTAEVRMSAVVLAAIPFFVTAALSVLAPSYLEALFKDPRGNFILGLALLLLVLAGIVMRGMIRDVLAISDT